MCNKMWSTPRNEGQTSRSSGATSHLPPAIAQQIIPSTAQTSAAQTSMTTSAETNAMIEQTIIDSRKKRALPGFSIYQPISKYHSLSLVP